MQRFGNRIRRDRECPGNVGIEQFIINMNAEGECQNKKQQKNRKLDAKDS